MNDQFVPVTQAQSTETKINQSVKISKQLMKAELKKRMVALKVQYELSKKETADLHSKFLNQLKSNVTAQARMAIANDGELTRFRNLYTKFSRFDDKESKDFPAFTNNLDMVKEINWEDIATYVKPHFDTVWIKFRQNFLLGNTEVQIDLVLPDRIHEDDSDRYSSEPMENPLYFDQIIHVNQDLIDKLFEFEEKETATKELNLQYNEVDNKLTNIDAVAEDMEARLLVQELAKTDEGKAALAVAGELVGDMLGDVPALLTVDK